MVVDVKDDLKPSFGYIFSRHFIHQVNPILILNMLIKTFFITDLPCGICFSFFPTFSSATSPTAFESILIWAIYFQLVVVDRVSNRWFRYSFWVCRWYSITKKWCHHPKFSICFHLTLLFCVTVASTFEFGE